MLEPSPPGKLSHTVMMWLVYCILGYLYLSTLCFGHSKGSIWVPRDEGEKPQTFVALQPFTAAGVICTMPISQTEDRSKSVLCRFREECAVFLWVDLEYLSPFSLLYFLWCFSEERARRASGVRGWKQFHGAQQHSRCRAPAQMAVVWLFFVIYHFQHLPFTKYLRRTRIVIQEIRGATPQLVY